MQSTIETPRLSIVPFSEAYLTPRYVSWLNDPEVVRYSEQRHHAHTLESCRDYRQTFTDTSNRFWAIVAHDAALGHIGNINAYVDVENGVADVGIMIGERSAWRQGYGSEAWQAVCDYLLEDCGLRKITAGTLSVNHGMLNVMRKAGMTDDKQPRRQVMFEGQAVEVVQMSLERATPLQDAVLSTLPHKYAAANGNSLRIALIGCGSIGRRHLANLRSLTCDRPVNIIVYDVSAQSREAVAAEYDIVSAACPDELWEFQPHVAFICTPSHLHTCFGLAAAHAGAALFIEKPVSHDMDGLDELNALVVKHKQVNLVGCNMRFHPGPALLKQWLESGIIGDVLSARLHTGSYLPAWRPQQDYRAGYSASPAHGGALLDCIHEIDLALWLLGPASLHSSLVRPATSLGLETDGMAELLLTHQNGAFSSVHLNFVQRNYQRCIEIIGSEGTLAWDFTTGETIHYDASGAAALTVRQPDDWQVNQMYRDELAYFLACVERNAPTFNSVDDATQTLRLALQARSTPESNPCQ